MRKFCWSVTYVKEFIYLVGNIGEADVVGLLVRRGSHSVQLVEDPRENEQDRQKGR